MHQTARPPVNDTHYISNKVLKINVGFLLSEGAGHSRDTEFDIPSTIRIADDLSLDYLRGPLRMSRTSRGILVQGTLSTRFETDCTRCLEAASIELEIPIEELFVSPPEPGAEFVVADDGILDLSPLLREEIITNTPQHVLCKPDCAGLCLDCGANLNDGPCECDQSPIDPRLMALKALKDQLKAQEAKAK